MSEDPGVYRVDSRPIRPTEANLGVLRALCRQPMDDARWRRLRAPARARLLERGWVWPGEGGRRTLSPDGLDVVLGRTLAALGPTGLGRALQRRRVAWTATPDGVVFPETLVGLPGLEALDVLTRLELARAEPLVACAGTWRELATGIPFGADWPGRRARS